MSMEKYASHSIFSHEIFRSREFQDFSNRLLTTMNSTPPPESIALMQTIPLVADVLQSLQSGQIIANQQLIRSNSFKQE